MLSKDPYSVRDEAAKFRIEIEKYINTQNEANLMVGIFKHVSFYNLMTELNTNIDHRNHIKGLIYDELNSLVSVLQKRERYLQLNIRSMVEHIARIALNKSYAGGDFDGTVRRVDFEYLKRNNPTENWPYLHNVYIRACHYVHSSPQANLNISSKFFQLMDNDCNSSQSSLVKTLHKASHAIMNVFTTYFQEEIANIFYRDKADLKFLLGNSLYSAFEVRTSR
ncbi:hypothetical protein FZN08_09595 [Escherichia coli]|uniref:hypothetical protein n=1 Tax=Escherichia coli TaxID=562 RepID=UPI001372C06D|nr:hypothetical protein [Escherichia coli]NAQ79470.1 hypothetical protein [Escherichia coli]